ncbi:hypothetical protein [Aestuariimicrobium kwangyangense]|uniref:hypothetical protein n=1 Tax=Aestuariimicrobium kwangyangense TaxID=396389 RepID=UPI0012FBB48A|nr:hypothetical protein [Aestuariimicrobium kwangyangense]
MRTPGPRRWPLRRWRAGGWSRLRGRATATHETVDAPPVRTDDEDTLVLRTLAPDGSPEVTTQEASPDHGSQPRHLPPPPNPELAAMARQRVRITRIGVGAALLGAVAMVAASVVRVDGQADRLWSTAANVGAVMVLLVCLLQWRLWVLAWLEWRGVRSARLSPWLGLSKLGGWMSVVTALVEAFAGWRATLTPAAGGLATMLTWLALVLSACGVVLAGLRGFKPSEGEPVSERG